MIVACPECRGAVSDVAVSCPHCGYAGKPQPKPQRQMLAIFSIVVLVAAGLPTLLGILALVAAKNILQESAAAQYMQLGAMLILAAMVGFSGSRIGRYPNW